jgi:hypothetical protein
MNLGDMTTKRTTEREWRELVEALTRNEKLMLKVKRALDRLAAETDARVAERPRTDPRIEGSNPSPSAG